MLHTYDSWKLAPEDEEPTVEEMWSGSRGEYVHVVTFANGSQFTIVQEREGAYRGDFAIHGDGYYANGYSSPKKAIDRLIDMARDQ